VPSGSDDRRAQADSTVPARPPKRRRGGGDGAPRLLVLKVGGALFSDKRQRSLDSGAVAGYARQVADLTIAAPGRVVFVTGGGSYGHAAVRSLDPHDPLAPLPLTEATFALKWIWTEALRVAGVRAVPLQLTALAALERGRLVAHVGVLRRLLRECILPVLSGDCLIASDGSLQVFSSDRVPEVLLGLSTGATRVVTLTDVPGILTDGPHGHSVLREVDPDKPEAAYRYLWQKSAWDTTRSMTGKLDALVGLALRGAECLILKGDPAGTSLRFLLEPLDRWPPDVRYTRIAR